MVRSKLAFLPIAITCVVASPAYAQSFSLDTLVTPDSSQYNYAFTINYDQQGAALALTDNIWEWSFDVNSGTPLPTNITVPTGWQYAYNQPSDQFDFYTEGPNGFGNGDFGNNVILPGQSLSGFGLTTPAAPDLSIAFATDVQYNQDANTALLPTSIPAAVPEASIPVSFSVLLFLGSIGLVARKRAQRKV